MDHSSIDYPCILFALRRESAPFCRVYRPHRTFGGAPCRARLCGTSPRSVVVLETGVGQANVAAALDWISSTPSLEGGRYRPGGMLFAGFAGALTDALHVGDIVVADEVVDQHGGRWPTTWPTTPDFHRGRLVTTEVLLGEVAAKRALGEQSQAIAVEMESALFADRCTRAGIPFGCVRAISDDAATSLSPALVSLLSGGTVSPWRLLAGLVRQPTMLPELWRLGRDTGVASQRLATALESLLTPKTG